MKAWRAHSFGGPECLVLDDVDQPVAGDGEVLIQNRAAGLNFFDVLQLQGKYQEKPAFPFIPGAEISGRVVSLGRGVQRLNLLDRVIAVPRINGFSEFISVNADNVFLMPSEMSFIEGASFTIMFHTAFLALKDRGRLLAGQTLLVHAGASGVGCAAIQIGRALGARVVATAGSESKREFARQQGAEQVWDYSGPGWVDRAKEFTNQRSADIIFDPVGGDIFDLSMKCIAPEGRILVIGFTSGRIPSIAANRLLLRNASTVGVHWGHYIDVHPEYLRSTHEQLMELYRERKIWPVVGIVHPFVNVREALQDVASRRVMGKAVLQISD